MTSHAGSKNSPVDRLPINSQSSQQRCALSRALKSNQEATVSAQHIFSNVEYMLTFSVRLRDGESVLAVDLQDSSTTECWSANFDTARMI